MTDWRKRAQERREERRQSQRSTAQDMIEAKGDDWCQLARQYLKKKREYESTHEYTEAKGYMDLTGWGIMVPLKYKSNGELVKWPGYSKDPPGLYKVPTRNGGYEYELQQPWGAMLSSIGAAGYNSVEEYVDHYCGGSPWP